MQAGSWKRSFLRGSPARFANGTVRIGGILYEVELSLRTLEVELRFDRSTGSGRGKSGPQWRPFPGRTLEFHRSTLEVINANANANVKVRFFNCYWSSLHAHNPLKM
jgi:hypothetical protein